MTERNSSMQRTLDEDDIDLFVSPGRFGGRTPSAAATRLKIFQEDVVRAGQVARGGCAAKWEAEADIEHSEGLSRGHCFEDGKVLQITPLALGG